jgi:hypothetical protein
MQYCSAEGKESRENVFVSICLCHIILFLNKTIDLCKHGGMKPYQYIVWYGFMSSCD